MRIAARAVDTLTDNRLQNLQRVSLLSGRSAAFSKEIEHPLCQHHRYGQIVTHGAFVWVFTAR
jgi:hypothetical protein